MMYRTNNLRSREIDQEIPSRAPMSGNFLVGLSENDITST